MNRRHFLSALGIAFAAGCTGSLAPPPPTARKRVLILGGTNFVGPILVEEALRRGHTVTLFNRRRSRADLFPQLEQLLGNRYPDRDTGLRALEGTREWDIVLDTWSSAPGAVRATAELLRGRVGFYGYISSISVYGRFAKIGIDESVPAVSPRQAVDPMKEDLPYPIAKAEAERMMQAAFGGPHGIYRATSINGRDYAGDPKNQQVYWPLRFLRGGEVLAPVGPAPFQYIDVKDLAELVLSTAERREAGIVNVVGPKRPIDLREYIGALATSAPGKPALQWIPTEFLLANGVAPFEDLPSWIPANDPEPGFFQISNAKAIGLGLRFRPLAETIRDVYTSYGGRDLAPHVAGGMAPEKERRVLELWRERQGGASAA